MASKLVEKRNALTAKQAALAKVFEEAGESLDFSKVTSLDGDTTEAKVASLRARNTELEDLAKEVEGLAAIEGMKDRVAGLGKDLARAITQAPHADPTRSPLKGLGRLIVESPAFEQYRRTKGLAVCELADFGLAELKTLFQTTAGWAPESLRIPGLVIEAVTRPIQVLDIIPPGTTGMAAVVYMEETTRTHAAAEAAEGAAYAESTFALTQRSSTVRKVADSIPVTDEQLEDVEGVASYLDNRLTFGLRQRLDNQILNGNGTAPNLLGILNVAGIQTQAKGTDPVPDAIYKALVKVRVTGRAFPNFVLMHPNDWQDVRLLRTADGIYIWGSPSESGPERIWGLRLVQTDALTENTGLVGDFQNFCQLYERRGIEVAIGYVGTQFTEGEKTIRADLRVAFVVYRAAAFATVTGI